MEKPPRAMEMTGASNCKRNETLFHAAAESAEQERCILLSPSRPTLTVSPGQKKILFTRTQNDYRYPVLGASTHCGR